MNEAECLQLALELDDSEQSPCEFDQSVRNGEEFLAHLQECRQCKDKYDPDSLPASLI